MGKRERDKGKRGELMLRDVLFDHGWFGAERGQQRAGGPDSPDVRGGPPGYHFEAKFVERLSARQAHDQATRDSGPGEVPIVAWKQRGKPWLAILSLDELLRLIGDAEPR